MGKEPDEAIPVGRPASRDPVAISSDDDVVVAVGIELDEGHLIDQAQLVEQPVDGAPRLAAEDVVDLRAEPIATQLEGMRVAAGRVVGLDDDHPSPGVSEDGRGGETGHAGAHHQIVAVQRRCLHARHANTLGDGIRRLPR